ncbi:MAG: Gfo/Idh/MocA family oxidoreductase [Bacteroidales bacterium]|jgi:predicted dehydrogenase|nr:Gfo/Idh/MocA family oxidoreductase [Bacteroidales bacterium]
MKIRMGMIGGGEGSLIGPVHRMAARLDGLTELVCGAFSSDHNVSLATGAKEGLPESRVYRTWNEMIGSERKLPPEVRPHFISIVTPNNLHFGPAMAALEAGFHVVCDKPLCMTVAEAAQLQETVERTGLLFCLTHNYTGYPMVKRAREIVKAGEIGDVRKVIVEYLQGWLSAPEEKKGNRQAEWRSDPERAGMAGAMADIGTHAFNLAEYITGEEVTELSARLHTVVPGRLLDDDGTVSLLFRNGATGSLLASQVATGEENNLSIRIYGEKGGISWRQMEPNTLTLSWKNGPVQLLRTGTSFPETGTVAAMHTRIPAGHPEGFIEAFANLYRNFAMHIAALRDDRNQSAEADYPGVYEGVRGMKFLKAAVDSSSNGSVNITL